MPTTSWRVDLEPIARPQIEAELAWQLPLGAVPQQRVAPDLPVSPSIQAVRRGSASIRQDAGTRRLQHL